MIHALQKTWQQHLNSDLLQTYIRKYLNGKVLRWGNSMKGLPLQCGNNSLQSNINEPT